jgi:Ser/Thr protein kinase RdoA (MazF antagonist)
MDYLSRNGMKVASPIESSDGNFVELIEWNDDVYLACLFEKAKGEPLKDKKEFTESQIKAWGSYLGRMHALSKKYSPRESRRPLWSDDSGFAVTLSGLDPSDQIPFDRFNEFIDWLEDLEKTKDSFGLIHADLHHGNFFVHNGEITAFDFDDCVYHWFSFDIAVPLYNLLHKSEDGFFDVSFSSIKENFISGYLETNSLEDIWLKRVDLFLLFRMVTVYHWINASKKEGVFDDSTLPWCNKALRLCKKYLEPKVQFF